MKADRRLSGSAARGQLFAMLAALERAGVPASRSLESIAETCPADLAEKVRATWKGIGSQNSLAQAGLNSGLFLSWEADLIQAGIEVGELASCYAQLCRHHERLASRLRVLKSRLIMPFAVVIIALVVTPLPALARGQLDATGYVAKALLPLSVLLLSLLLLRRAWARIASLESAPPGASLMIALPVLGKFLRRQQQCHALEILALLLKAGLPAGRALEVAASVLRDPRLRNGCQHAAKMASSGSGVAEALTVTGVCDEPRGLALIRSGEKAGKLDDAITRYSSDLDLRLNSQLDFLAKWLPFLLYFGLAVPYLL